MRRHTGIKIILFLSAFCMIAGLLMMTPAWLSGASPEVMSVNGRYVPYQSAAQEPAKEHKEPKRSLEPIQALDIQVGHTDITLIPSDEFAVETCYYTPDKPITCTQSGGVLTIQQEKSWTNSMEGMRTRISLGNGFGFTNGTWSDLSSNASGYVRLYVPKDTDFEKITLSTETGDCTLADFSSGKTRIQASFGSLSLKNARLGEAELLMENAQGALHTLQADSLSIKNNFGSLEMSGLQAAKGALNISCENTEVRLDGADALSFQLKNNFGKTDLSRLKIAGPGSLNAENGELSISDSSFSGMEIKNKFGGTSLEKIRAATGALILNAENGNVSIAGSAFSSMNIENKFGAISLEKTGTETGDLVLNAENGDISLLDITSGALRIKNTFGQCRLNQIRASGEGEIRTENGDCRIDDAVFPSLLMHSSFARLEGTKLQTGGITASTGNGDIQLEGTFRGECNVTSGLGRITFTTSLPETSYTLDADAGSRDLLINGRNSGHRAERKDPAENSLKCSTNQQIELTFAAS